MRRLFCAVKVPGSDSITTALEDFRQALQGESVRWVDPGNLHITLKFFGPTPLKAVDDILQALHKAAAICPPFLFNIRGCGTFGSVRQPRVLWLGTENASELSNLYQEVNTQLSPLGYVPDKDIFSPHLTIGRIKEIQSTHALREAEARYSDHDFSLVEVNSFYLFESLLKPTGPEYKVVEAFELGEGHRA